MTLLDVLSWFYTDGHQYLQSKVVVTSHHPQNLARTFAMIPELVASARAQYVVTVHYKT